MRRTVTVTLAVVVVGPTAWTVCGAAVESPDATGASAPQRHPGDIGRRRLASCQAAVRSHGALEATA
jgi:hypothetical protein